MGTTKAAPVTTTTTLRSTTTVTQCANPTWIKACQNDAGCRDIFFSGKDFDATRYKECAMNHLCNDFLDCEDPCWNKYSTCFGNTACAAIVDKHLPNPSTAGIRECASNSLCLEILQCYNFPVNSNITTARPTTPFRTTPRTTIPRTTKAPVTTKPATKGTATGPPKLTWAKVGAKVACDTNAGEVYLKQSPGRVQDLSRCKDECVKVSACKSISFFRSGWCSLFSTPCTKVTPMR